MAEDHGISEPDNFPRPEPEAMRERFAEGQAAQSR